MPVNRAATARGDVLASNPCQDIKKASAFVLRAP